MRAVEAAGKRVKETGIWQRRRSGRTEKAGQARPQREEDICARTEPLFSRAFRHPFSEVSFTGIASSSL